MSRSEKIIDLEVHRLHSTDKAVLITTDLPENGVWLPKSQIELTGSGKGELWDLQIPEWLAIEKGLV